MRMQTQSFSSKKRNEDRFSVLPDMLLEHILSFLDIRAVIQTSILSKRWTLVWSSYPFLNFPLTNCTKDFVNKVFLHRDNFTVQKLHFPICNPYFTLESLNSWVVAALRRNVQELHLFIPRVPPRSVFSPEPSAVGLRHCLFTSQSLTVLKLASVYAFRVPLEPPDSIYLPRLKTLYLKLVSFRDETVFNIFFEKCPVLESLVLLYIGLNEVKGVNLLIFKEMLKHLTVEDFHYPLQLFVPNLKSLSLKRSLARYYTLGVDIPLLDNAVIELGMAGSACFPSAGADNMRMLLQAISNVKYLSLPGSLSKMISETLPEQKTLAMQFVSLKYLMLKADLNTDFRAIASFLRASPYIETLVIEQTSKSVPPIYTFGDEVASNLLDGMLHHLKVIEIRGFQGCIYEQIILKIALKASLVLERIVLDSQGNASNEDEKRLQFSETLIKFPRASPNIIAILFV